MEEIVVLSTEDAHALRQMAAWIRNFRGDGVTNTPDGAVVAALARGASAGYQRRSAPILAQVTAIHDNYVEAVKLVPNGINGVWTAPSGAPTIYIARHPSTQKQFYNGLTVTDPVTATDWAFTYVGPQTRTATDGVSTIHQRCVPWYSTDANAPPITAVSCSAPVPNDGADGVIRCTFMEIGPGYWAEYTLGAS